MITEFLLHHFSYWILFFWSILEGEIGLTLAGFLAKKGVFSIEKIILIATAGALIGDILLYTSGRFLIKKKDFLPVNYKKRIENIEHWFHKHGILVIIFERFIYGTHIPSLLFVGMSGFSFWKFFIVDIIGVFLWSVVFTSLGYLFGESIIGIMIVLQKHLSVLFLVLFFVLIIFLQNKEEK